jgi:hypothetical protein
LSGQHRRIASGQGYTPETIEVRAVGKPEPCEWGKLNAGQTFQVLALDIFRALFHAGLNDYEQKLMQYVIEQSWFTSACQKGLSGGWPEPLFCRLSMTDVAREFGIEGEPKKTFEARRKRLYEARASLVRSRILVEDGDGVWINKNASDWLLGDGETVRLESGSLAYALRARRLAVPEKPGKRARKNGHGSPEFRASVSGIPGKRIRNSGQKCPEKRASMPVDDKDIQKHESERNPQHANGVSDSEFAGIPVAMPAGAPASEDKDSQKTKEDVGVITPTPPGGEAAPGPEPFENEAGPTTPPAIVGPGCNSPAALELEAWAGSLGLDRNHESYAYWARQACDDAPARWVRLLLERLVKGRDGTRRATLPYLATILARWRADGRCEFEVDGAPGGGPASASPAAPRLGPAEQRRLEARESAKNFDWSQFSREGER